MGSGLNPGVELAPPPSLSSNRRERAARKNVQNVADTSKGGGRRSCQDNWRGIWCADSMAPQSGHVSNFCGLKRGPLEPIQLISGQSHPHKSGAPIQAGAQTERISNFRAFMPKVELAPGRQSMKVIPNAVSW